GFAVIDDTYNSNPKALTEMIRFCGKLKDFSRKIIVAGEMLELGPEGPQLHRECGQEAARAGAALIIGVQGMGQEIVNGARESGVPEERLKFFAKAADAGEFLNGILRRGDVVLMKGSRGVKLEQALSALRSKFSGAEP